MILVGVRRRSRGVTRRTSRRGLVLSVVVAQAELPEAHGEKYLSLSCVDTHFLLKLPRTSQVFMFGDALDFDSRLLLRRGLARVCTSPLGGRCRAAPQRNLTKLIGPSSQYGDARNSNPVLGWASIGLQLLVSADSLSAGFLFSILEVLWTDLFVPTSLRNPNTYSRYCSCL